MKEKNISSKYEIPILDLYSIGDFFPEDKIFLKQYGIDGVHPNQKFVKEFFDQAVIEQMLEEHYHNKKNNGRKIYNIYSFLTWYKVYFLDEKNV